MDQTLQHFLRLLERTLVLKQSQHNTGISIPLNCRHAWKLDTIIWDSSRVSVNHVELDKAHKVEATTLRVTCFWMNTKWAFQ